MDDDDDGDNDEDMILIKRWWWRRKDDDNVDNYDADVDDNYEDDDEGGDDHDDEEDNDVEEEGVAFLTSEFRVQREVGGGEGGRDLEQAVESAASFLCLPTLLSIEFSLAGPTQAHPAPQQIPSAIENDNREKDTPPTNHHHLTPALQPPQPTHPSSLLGFPVRPPTLTIPASAILYNTAKSIVAY